MEENHIETSQINYSEIEQLLQQTHTHTHKVCRLHGPTIHNTQKNEPSQEQIITEETPAPTPKALPLAPQDSQICKFFCNLCDEPVCLKCIQEGPHNSFAHQIIKIEKAAEIKLEKLRTNINSGILKERQSLVREIEVANYIQNTLLVKVFADIKGEMAKDFWAKIGNTERKVKDQVKVIRSCAWIFKLRSASRRRRN